MEKRDADLQTKEHRINNESPYNRSFHHSRESEREKIEKDKSPYNPKVQNLIVEYKGNEQQSSYLDRVRKYPQNRPNPNL